jgi:hypothetical protein
VHVVHARDMRNAYSILIGQPEGKINLEDKGVNGSRLLKQNLRNTAGDWIHLAQNRIRLQTIVNTVAYTRGKQEIRTTDFRFSVSIVSDYGLNDRAIGVRSPAGAKDFSSNLCVQTGSEANPASCKMGNGGPFLGAKRGRGVTLTTHPHLMPRSRMSRSYTTSPPKLHHGV